MKISRPKAFPCGWMVIVRDDNGEIIEKLTAKRHELPMLKREVRKKYGNC